MKKSNYLPAIGAFALFVGFSLVSGSATIAEASGGLATGACDDLTDGDRGGGGAGFFRVGVGVELTACSTCPLPPTPMAA